MRNRWVWIVLTGMVAILVGYGWSFFPSFERVIFLFQNLSLLTRQLLIIGGIVVAILLIALLVIRERLLRQLRSKSPLYKQLIERNVKTKFHSIKRKIQLRQRYSSKAKLDRTSVQSVFADEITNRMNAYEELANKLQANQRNWEDYSSFYQELLEQVKTTTPWYVRFVERELLQRQRLVKPVIDLEFFILMTYTSPKGRNHYEKKIRYYAKDFLQQIKRSQQYLELVSTQEYLRAKERSKMTASMRFNILKRDDYRCQICGASQKDGAKLHIDHIVPVANGGKTIESNLHVLCDRCNLGKGTRGL